MNKQSQIVNLLNNIDPEAKEKKISVHSNDKVIFVNTSDICYIEADDRYCNLTTVKAEKYTIAKTLREFEEFLSENPIFIRISKSVMLNVNCIKAYAKEEPYYIEMKDGKMYEIARRKKQEVLERLKK